MPAQALQKRSWQVLTFTITKCFSFSKESQYDLNRAVNVDLS